MTQPALPVDRPYDLPPAWDGRIVVWDGWDASYSVGVFICPPPKPECCPACGSLAPRPMNRGRVAVSTRVTREQIVENVAARDRLPFDVRHRLKSVALYELTAFRCPDCRLDQVLDGDRKWWILDESDYLDSGSFPPA